MKNKSTHCNIELKNFILINYKMTLNLSCLIFLLNKENKFHILLCIC